MHYTDKQFSFQKNHHRKGFRRFKQNNEKIKTKYLTTSKKGYFKLKYFDFSWRKRISHCHSSILL